MALSAALFVATGLAQTLIVQSLLYSGGGDRRTLLLALPNYVGITLVAVAGGPAFRALDGLGVWCGTPRAGAAPARGAPAAAVAAGGGGGGGGGISVSGSGGSGISSGGGLGTPFVAAPSAGSAAAAAAAAASPSAARNRVHAVAYGTPPPPSLRGAPWYATALHPERRRLFLLAVNECGGFVAGISGIAIAGSGLYQVVFSGGTVVTAVLSVAFLKRRLSAAQWAAVCVITGGLLVTAAGQVRPGAGGGVLTGICFVLVSCGFYRYVSSGGGVLLLVWAGRWVNPFVCHGGVFGWGEMTIFASGCLLAWPLGSCMTFLGSYFLTAATDALCRICVWPCLLSN